MVVGNGLIELMQMPTGCTKLVLKSKSRFINRPTKTGKKTYDKFFIYVPTDVAKDSAFPFKDGDEVEVEIDAKGKRLLVKRV